MVLQFLKQNTSGPRLLSLLPTSNQSDSMNVTFTSKIRAGFRSPHYLFFLTILVTLSPNSFNPLPFTHQSLFIDFP